ncbi:MAG: NADH-quinone oxidoreductase subunit C, partial [Poseidonia sp.]
MGMRITNAQADAAAEHAVASLVDRFGGSDVAASVEHHANAYKMAFTRVNVPAQHWTAVAKHLRFDLGVNYCSMVTGTHYPEGGADRGWEVVYHLMRQPVV